MPSTTLIALTLNEIDGVKAILPQIDRSLFDQMLILDGNSTDGTLEWCREQGYEVYVQQKRGVRHAYLEALPLIRGDIVVTISPDGNCDPAVIPNLLEKARDGYDLVIGSRYLPPSTSEDDDFLTGLGNWLFTRTVNVLHGGHYTDAMVIYRAFRRELVYELDLDRDEAYVLPERLFGTVISWEPLMSVRAAKARKRIGEVAAGEPPRLGGIRKLQVWRWGAAYYFQFWFELFFWRPRASGCVSVEGTIRRLTPARTFVDGQYFSTIEIEAPGGTMTQLSKVFVVDELLPHVRPGRGGRFCLWNNHLYGIVPADGDTVADVYGARKAFFGRDRLLLVVLAATVILSPIALVVVLRRLRRSGSAAAMWRTLRAGASA